jgi:hypothetical protein
LLRRRHSPKRVETKRWLTTLGALHGPQPQLHIRQPWWHIILQGTRIVSGYLTWIVKQTTDFGLMSEKNGLELLDSCYRLFFLETDPLLQSLDWPCWSKQSSRFTLQEAFCRISLA